MANNAAHAFGGCAIEMSYMALVGKDGSSEDERSAEEIIENMKNKLGQIGGGGV